MGPVSGIVVYLITWWVVLFMVLPLGVRTPDAPAAGHAPSAPARPRIRHKFLLTTIIAAVIWVVIYAIIEAELISFREMARDLR